MKKIAIIAFLLAVGVAAGRAQESRQDFSLSGTGIIEPFIASQTDVQVHSSYVPQFANGVPIAARTQDISIAYVRSFNFKKFNPFAEAGPGAFIFEPIRNIGTGTLDAKRQTGIGAIYGAGVAYEISPSFDIRAEYRGFVTKVPTFGVSAFATNKYFNIFVPTVGVAYHF
jgi:opacity protein-like surface antigen